MIDDDARIVSDNFALLPVRRGERRDLQAWRKLVPSWIGIELVELPGRRGRTAEAPIDDFDTLVAQLTAELFPRLPCNCAFLGIAWALLGYGCAAVLTERRVAIATVLQLACCSAPSRRDIGGSERNSVRPFRLFGAVVGHPSHIARRTKVFTPASKAVAERNTPAGGNRVPGRISLTPNAFFGYARFFTA
jgi:hypothetical protein